MIVNCAYGEDSHPAPGHCPDCGVEIPEFDVGAHWFAITGSATHGYSCYCCRLCASVGSCHYCATVI